MNRHAMGGAVSAVVVVVAAIWWVALRPAIIGGPATYLLVAGRSMEPTIHAGSLAIAFRQPMYGVGDVVVYRIPDGNPAAGRNVIHRIVGGSAERGFVMQGDNADGSDLWRPRQADILGRAQIVVSGAMPVLLFARSPIVAASAAAAFAVYLLLGLWPPRPRPVAVPEPRGVSDRRPSRTAFE